MAEPILNLEVLEERFVAINGQPYRLLHESALDLLAIRRRDALVAEYNALQVQLEHAADLPEEEADRMAERLSGLLFSLCRIALRAPDEVIRRLSDVQRLQVLQAFTGPLPAAAEAKPEGAIEASTGGSGSPA